MKPQTFLFVTSWIVVIVLSLFAIFAKDPLPKSFPLYFGMFLFCAMIGFTLSYDAKERNNEHLDRPAKTK